MLQTALPPEALLRDLLDETDRFAVETVRAGQGGPFGASIHIYDRPGSHVAMIERIGGIAANAVLAKGLASAHAESEVISPENVERLKARLKDFNRHTVQVVLSSSGQSCPACTAKEEILARHLVEEELIQPKNFIVTYGATYRDTFNVASFNDEPYAADMRLPAGTGMVKQIIVTPDQISSPIAGLILGQDFSTAVIIRDQELLGIGHDVRAVSGDLMATAEVSAIRDASLRAKHKEGRETPWDLGGATLYTSTAEIGPLAYAECQWANVTTWASIEHHHALPLSTQEAPAIRNRDLFEIVGKPRRHASDDFFRGLGSPPFIKDIITTLHLQPFKNLAQHEWKKRLESEADPSKILYNGIDTNAPGPA